MLDLLLATHPYAVLIFDAKGVILQTNEPAMDLFGYESDELQGKPLSILLRNEDVGVHAAHFNEFTSHQRQFRQMSNYRPAFARHKNGVDFPIDASIGSSVLDERNVYVAVIRAGSSEKRDEKQLRSIALFPLENPSPVFRVQSSGEILFTNTSGDWLLGKIANRRVNFVPEKWAEAARQALLDQRPQQRIYELAGRYYSCFFAPIKMMGYVNIFCQDITEWEIEKDKFALSDDILGSIGNLVLVANSKAKIIYVSPSVKRILGYDPEEVLGEGWWKIDRDSGGSMSSEKRYISKAAAGRTVVDETPHEHRIQHKDGSMRWLRMADAKGPRDLIIGIGTDISDIKLAEEELQNQRDFAQTLTSQMGQGLTVTDEKGRFIFVNPFYAQMLGYEAQELIGMTPFDVTYPEDHIELENAGSLRRSGKITTYESKLRGRDGHEIFALITGVPRLVNEKYSGAITVITDLTERRRTENVLRENTEIIQKNNLELAEARDRALEASYLKSVFLATMSHEIRTPMNAIMGMTELLLDTELNEEQKEFASTIDASTKNLLAVLNDILDFSKIEAGKLTIIPKQFKLLDLIQESIKLFQPNAEANQINLSASSIPTLPDNLVGDAGRIGQVLSNLISNAIKFTKAKGQVSITVTGSPISGGKFLADFHVIDNGEGIPENLRPQLFEPFTQADSSSTRRHGGSGLGLAISKRLVDLMGGEIGFESSVESGSDFWFRLPLRSLPSGAEDNRQITAEQAQKLELDFSYKKTVLVVDDSPINRDLLSMQLLRFNLVTQTAGNGREAVELLQKYHDEFSLVFMDIHMQEMDGYTATKLIRDNETTVNYHIPIIAVTADALIGNREQCLLAGMDDFISKPVSLADIRTMLTKWLQETQTIQNSNKPSEKDIR